MNCQHCYDETDDQRDGMCVKCFGKCQEAIDDIKDQEGWSEFLTAHNMRITDL